MRARWWLWWGDMRRMRWTRRTVNRMTLTEWRRELIPQVWWCVCEKAVDDLEWGRYANHNTPPIVTLVHLCLSGHVPSYLADDCRLVTDAGVRRLRTVDTRTQFFWRPRSTDMNMHCWNNAGNTDTIQSYAVKMINTRPPNLLNKRGSVSWNKVSTLSGV